jgi:hypothetical protein
MEKAVAWLHYKPSPFAKQFYMAIKPIFTSYITFQSNHDEIFQSKQMWIMNFLFSLLDKIFS